MNIQELQSEKLELINWISQLQDFSVVELIKSVKNSQEKYILSDLQKKAIDESFESIAQKGTIPNSIVMAEAKNRFPHLFK